MKKVKFKTHIDQLDYLNMHYLFIPGEIIKKMGGTLKQRVHCTVNNAITFQSGFMALNEGNAFISINAARMKKLGVQKGDRVEVELRENKSRYGMEMSAELKEVLAQDPEGDRRFHNLTPGKQRYIIYYVSQVKSPHLRADRAVKLITNLKACKEGKEEFRDILGIVK